MHLTKYFFTYPISDNQFYLLHTLTGNLELLSLSEHELLVKWSTKDNITPNSSEEDFYNQLINRNYILSDIDEEQMFDRALESARKVSIPSTPIVTFVLTYSCNFACPYCFEQNNNSFTDILSKEQVDKIFELHPNGISQICFYGGEPFLPICKSIVEYIVQKSPNSSFSAITNGYYLHEYLDTFKSVSTSFIQVTLDGTELTHNQTRVLKNGAPTYKQILSNIDLFLSNNIPIKIRMNISQENVHSCLSFRDYMLEKYIGKPLSFELQPLFQYNQEEKNKLEEIIYTSDLQGSDLLESDYFTRNIIVNTFLPFHHYITSRDARFRPILNNCDAETRRICYDARGDFYSCLVSVGDTKSSCGTYFPQYTEKKNSLLRRSVLSIPECQKCRFLFLCGGGCGYHAMDSSGNPFHPNCVQIRHVLTTIAPKYIVKKFHLSEN